MKDYIHLVCCANAKYAAALCVMLKSVELTLRDSVVKVHVIDAGIPDALKAKIAVNLDPAVMELHWLQPDMKYLSGLSIEGHAGIETYCRLLLPWLLSEEIAKVIYLDVDLVVLTDLTKLWRTDCSEAIVCAVPEPSIPQVSSPMGVFNYMELGIPKLAPYFNGGVMLLNCEKWRNGNVSVRILEYLKKHGSLVHYWDQGGMNAVLWHDWVALDPRWNETHVFNQELARFKSGGAQSERLKRNPHIVHFTGSAKPWQKLCADPRKDLFHKILAYTTFKPEIPPLSILERACGTAFVYKLRLFKSLIAGLVRRFR